MHWKSRLSVKAYGMFATALFKPGTPPPVMRARFERVGRVSREKLKRKYPSIQFEDHDFEGLHAESTRSVRQPVRVIMHLHGGAYVMGSSGSFRVRAKNLSYRGNAIVYMVDYRRSPEHTFPAALDDAQRAWSHIRRRHPEMPVCLSGDSCGGGLALSLMMRLRDENEVLPDAAILFSPWTDLANRGESYRYNADKDGWLTHAHTEQWAGYYLGGSEVTNPLISPLYGQFAGLPPLLFLVGGNEVLLDDTLVCVQKAREQGVNVQVEVGEGMTHDYPLSLPWLSESQEAWNLFQEFLTGHCTRATN